MESKNDPMLQASHEEVVVALRQLAGLRVMPARKTALHLRLTEVCKAVARNKPLAKSTRSTAASKRYAKAA